MVFSPQSDSHPQTAHEKQDETRLSGFLVPQPGHILLPNQSPEPTAVGAGRSAIAGDVLVSVMAQLSTLGIAAVRIAFSIASARCC